MDKQNVTKKKPAEKELLNGLVDQLLKDYKEPEDILGEQSGVGPKTETSG